MKFLLFVIALIFCEGSYSHIINDKNVSDEKTDEMDNLKKEFDEIFKAKCEKAGGEKAYKQFMEGMESTTQCITKHLPGSANDTYDSGSSEEDLCTYKHTNIRECLNKMVVLFKDCSEPEEKYLPSFVFDVLDNIMNIICENNKFLSIDDGEAKHCIEEIFIKNDIFSICSNKMEYEIFKSKEAVLTKNELCTDIETYGKCFEKFLDKKCHKDKQFQKFVTRIHEAVYGPCKKEITS